MRDALLFKRNLEAVLSEKFTKVRYHISPAQLPLDHCERSRGKERDDLMIDDANASLFVFIS